MYKKGIRCAHIIWIWNYNFVFLHNMSAVCLYPTNFAKPCDNFAVIYHSTNKTELNIMSLYYSRNFITNQNLYNSNNLYLAMSGIFLREHILSQKEQKWAMTSKMLLFFFYPIACSEISPVNLENPSFKMKDKNNWRLNDSVSERHQLT